MLSGSETIAIDLLIAQRATSIPRHPAFYSRNTATSAWEALDWNTLSALVTNAKDVLRAAGAGEGCIIGLLLPTCITWEVVHIACLGIGATVVGLDYHDLGDNFRHVVEVSGVQVLVTDAAANRELVLPTNTSVTTRLIVALDGEHDSLAERVIVFQQPIQVPYTAAAEESPRTDALATIIFTSGSTRRPKGIGYTAEQLGIAVESIIDAFPQIDASKRTICWLPLSNLFQRIVNLCAIHVGAPIYFVSDPRQIMSSLREVRPSVLIAVPRFFEKVFDGIKSRLDTLPLGMGRFFSYLMLHSDANTRRGRVFRVICRMLTQSVRASFGGSIEFFISGSAPMPRWLLRNFDAMGLPVLEAYGLSENIVPISSNRVGACRYGSVGLAMRGNELRLSEDGELFCRGPGVCRQYFGDQVPLALDEEGFLATGDYADIDRDGFVWLKGRKSEIFKTTTGRRIAPTEVEEYVTVSGMVDHAVVFGEGRKFLIALVTVSLDPASSSAMVHLEEVRAAVSQAVAQLPSYKQPAGLLMLCSRFSPGTGELTANLKLKRKYIEAKYRTAIDALYAYLDETPGDSGALAQFDPTMFMGRI